MLTYITRRLLQGVFVIFIVTLIVFFTMRLLPGDPILLYVSSDEMTESTDAEIEILRQEFGLTLFTARLVSVLLHPSVFSASCKRVILLLWLGFKA